MPRLRRLRVALDRAAAAAVDVRIEVSLPLERAHLPPRRGLANRHHDRVGADAARPARRRLLVRVPLHLRARVARAANGALHRQDVGGISQSAAQLFLDLLQPRPVSARHLNEVPRLVDAGTHAVRRRCRQLAVANEEVDGLERPGSGVSRLSSMSKSLKNPRAMLLPAVRSLAPCASSSWRATTKRNLVKARLAETPQPLPVSLPMATPCPQPFWPILCTGYRIDERRLYG